MKGAPILGRYVFCEALIYNAELSLVIEGL